MQRRGFLGALIACVAAPFLPSPRFVEYPLAYGPNDATVVDTSRIDVFDRCEYDWREYSVAIGCDDDTMRPNGSYFRCK